MFKLFRKFARQRDGSMTVEAVLWLPMYVALIGLIVDVALIMHDRSRAMRLLHDAQRAYSLGWLETEADLQSAVIASLSNLSENVTAQTQLGADRVTTAVTIPASDLAPIGFFTSMVDVDLTFHSVHYIES